MASTKLAVRSAGIRPTQATTHPAAVGGHGMPSHSGQCWLHKALIFVPVVVSLVVPLVVLVAAGARSEADGIQA